MLFLKVILISCVSCCFANISNVVDLDDKNFKSLLVSYKVALVMFYATGCTHCQKLKPKFEEAAKKLEDNVRLAQVDCIGAGKNTCEEYFINEYPYLGIYRHGVSVKEYKLALETEDIVKRMTIEANKGPRKINSMEDFNKTIHECGNLVVGFFPEETNFKSEYLRVADMLIDKYTFSYTTSKELKDQFGITNSIIIFKPPHMKNPFEQSIVEYSGIDHHRNITDFVIKNYYGLVGHRKGKNKANFGFPIIITFYKSDNVNDHQSMYYWRGQILQVAWKFHGNITFAVSPQTRKELRQYGIHTDGDEVVIVARDVRNQKFVFDEEFSVENLEGFVDDVLNGHLEPYWRSEPLPSSNYLPLKQAVAQNFKEVVIENDKDTFVGFYAPWCPHCRSIAKDYENLAELLVGEEVDIVRMDATANDVPYPFEVRAFPTAYWVPKNSKEVPVLYRGKRTIDDVLKFIAANAAEELKGYYRDGNKRGKSEL